jgi:hypothetical protein
MKKLVKTNVYATSFHNWHTATGKDKHPKYSASDPHHKDVLIELIISQSGLCAYTEHRLVNQEDLERLKTSFDEDGRFIGELKYYPIDLEHFDSRLKTNYAWNYSNLFAVERTVNQQAKRIEEKKLIDSGKSVHIIMKPDEENYDESVVLCYDENFNIFLPNEVKLTTLEKEQVGEMLICLGINCGYIKGKRKEYYNELKIRQRLGDSVTPHQFITGWNMMNGL